ncbi:hypothetical protein FPOA_03756 [Fusarium poae]|uniref:Uncharacterized protein n=1 Tax=Fusarium poae TaxID=36050 RepID=A0A1B8ARM1_FUSPO|nr:hypothetical protein FPOA_03756 [Fusarium poae]
MIFYYITIIILSLTTQAHLKCHPEGSILPKPTSLTTSPIFKSSAVNLTSTLDAAISGSIKAGWPVNNVSFSLAVVSAESHKPVWEYHHLATANTRGTKDINRDSQYLIGSITKVFTVFVLLKSGVSLDASVTEFLPGLDGDRWKDVSLRMLASYLSGTPANYGFSEFYFLKHIFQEYGLPPIEDDEYPPCGVATLNKACTGQDIINGMETSYLQTTPNERPAYSNMAFVLLGMAIEEYTGKTFEQLLKDIVTDPLDMSNTFASPGNDSSAVIPPSDSSWGSDYGINTPAGGLVSSISDLSKFSHALLSRTLNMTPSEINGWFKPTAFAGNAYTMSGMPWEILRLPNFTLNNPHTVTVYSKTGGAQNYRSQLSFVDEYGLAIIVLTAGPMNAAPILADAVLSTFIDAADEISRVQAKRYEGLYRNEGGVVEAVLEHDGDSMVLTSLHRNGTDIVSSLVDIWGLTLGEFLPEIGPKIRVFPSELRETEGNVTREVWHLWPELDTGYKTDLPGIRVEEMNCVGWTIQDWVHYGGEPLDRVLVYVDQDGSVVGFEVPFLRSGIMYLER